MTTFDVSVSPGLRELLSMAALTGGGNVGAAASRAVYRTALDTRDLLVEETPKDTGDTAGRWQVTKRPNQADPTAVVSNDSVIMVYLEYGTPPHEIRAKNGKVLAFKMAVGSRLKDGKALYRSEKGRLTVNRRNAETVLVSKVNHPGTRPTFTVRGNLDKIQGMLVENMRKEVARLLYG